MVHERKRVGNSEKNRKSDDSSGVWFEATRSKKERGVAGHVGHKAIFRQDVVCGGTVMF